MKRATDNLVKAAQQAIQNDEERSLVLSKRMVGGIAQEINARLALVIWGNDRELMCLTSIIIVKCYLCGTDQKC